MLEIRYEDLDLDFVYRLTASSTNGQVIRRRIDDKRSHLACSVVGITAKKIFTNLRKQFGHYSGRW